MDDCGSSCQIKQCKSLTKLREILHFYQLINEEHQNNQYEIEKLIVEYIEKNDDTDNKNIINHFQNILKYHLNDATPKKNSHNYDFINSLMSRNIKCNIAKCNLYSRNMRDRDNADDNDDKHDKTGLYYIDLLDNIHSFLIHGYDVGFRIKYVPQNEYNDDEKSMDDDEMDKGYLQKLCIDMEMKSLQETIINKRRNLRNIRGDDRVKHNKFLTEFTEEKERKIADNDEKTNDEKTNDIVYSFGQPFYYWEWYKNNDLEQYSKWYINKKYNNLKDEIISIISLSEFNATKNKSMKLLETSNVLKSRVAREDYGYPDEDGDRLHHLNYGIAKGTKLTYDKVMSVLFYTDYTKLSYEFSKTFRRLSSNETDENLKKRNSSFWHWSKLLHEIVHLYGNSLNFDLSGQTNTKTFQEQQPQIPILYHGVSYIYFNSFVSKFSGPSSLTRQFSVATIFAENGIIVECEPYNGYNPSNPLYFNCSLISCFSSEDERLFIGSRGYYCSSWLHPDGGLLRFRSIRTMKDRKNYIWFVRALSLFNIIIHGDSLKNYKNLYVKRIDFYYRMINELLYGTESQKQKFPIYIQKCFKLLMNENNKRIRLSLPKLLSNGYVLFNKLFKWSAKCNYLLLFDYICDIFPNCTHIECTNFDTSTKTQFVITKLFVNGLIDIFKKIEQKPSMKLKQIRLNQLKFGSDMNDKLFEELFYAQCAREKYKVVVSLKKYYEGVTINFV